ncbi:hypothetical protein FH969_04800 [Miniimonas arenae]|uniref:Lipoprotein n=1 Tax=Miniimonas arenae TaxID=676201 RepID=A0A5C5BFM4_9MICO|nr:hypothetical protein [Miniimonas arenae]TNU76107.1 hypothetical protein FH969_04800 [Miniimonas arenae]
MTHHDQNRRTAFLLPVVLLTGAFALSACTGDQATFDPSGEGDAPASAGATPTGGNAPSQGSTSDASAAASGGDAAGIDPNDVVAEYTVPLPPGAEAAEGSTVTVGVHELRVQGDVMLLELYVTPDIAVDSSQEWSLYDLGGERSMWPILNDAANLKQYNLLMDDLGRRWVVDNLYTTTTDGVTALWWGYYAAPEDDIDTISVQVTQGHPVIDVPIER